MGRSIRYLLIFLITIFVATGWNADSVCAAETIRTGTFGVNNGINWEYNEGTKTLTVSGTDTFTSDDSIYYICYDVEKIIFKDCCIKGDAGGLFQFLGYLKEVDLSGLDTSNMTYMHWMFRGCSSLTSLDLSGFDTGNVVSMYAMFQGCRSLTTLDLSGFDTGNVTGMSDMFYGCSNLTSLDLSGFNTTKVKNMNSMFYNCSSLASLNLSVFNTTNVTNMNSMFYNCSSLASLNLSGFNTTNVTNMNSMFSGCSSLTSLDLSDFNTANVTGMISMFSECKKLANLDLGQFNTGKVTSMASMFLNCNSLQSLDLSGFNTANVTDMRYLFSGCSSVKNLDLSGFDTGKVTNMWAMFSGCSSLTDIDLSELDTANVTDMDSMFSGCSSLTDIDLSELDTANVTTMAAMFSGCSRLNDIDLSGLNTNNVKYMSSMFAGCKSLTSLDLSGFNTANVTGMYSMFSGCTGLKNLNLNSFNTAKVVDMESMFANCDGLNSLDLRSFDTSNVTNMKSMFYHCYNLSTLDLSGFDTSNVTSMYNMFMDCVNLSSLNISGFDTSNVTSMTQMFAYCHELKELDVSDFNTSKVDSMYAMFRSCSSLTQLDVSGFDTSNVTDMGRMFENCLNLTSVDVSNFNTSKVRNMEDMFWVCSKLTSVDVSGFDTSNVTNMRGMFQSCKNLIDVDVSGFNTANTTDMCYMFYGCAKLPYLDFSNFDTTKVTSTLLMLSESNVLEVVRAPKTMADGQVIGLPLALKDAGGNTVTQINRAHCGTTLSKYFLQIGADKTEIPEGESLQLIVKLDSKEQAISDNTKYAWTSSANKVATVSEKGVVKAVGVGTTTITCAKGKGPIATYTVTVVEKLEITGQPAGQSVVEGNSAVFKVTAKGSKLSYQWQVRTSSTGTWTNSGMTGAKTSSITVQGTMARNGYQYRCIITDGLGNKVTSNGVTLAVTPKLAITGQPKSQSVTEGGNAVFKVTATGSKLSYQWQFRTSSTGTWTNSGMTGSKTNSITVQGTTARNGYQYRCVITDGTGKKVTSNGATLTVTPKLAITGQPKSQSVTEGDSAVFKVTATGSKLSYQWQVRTSSAGTWKNSGMTGANTNSITVQGTAARNGYQYRCVITDGLGNKVTSNGATLTVAAKLAITSQPISQSVTEGANAVFKVTATGNKLSYQWQFRTSSEGEWKNSGMTGSNTNSITVQGTTARNGYQYRCVITDGSGNKVTSNGATLTVTPKLAITSQPTSQSVTEGANAVFKVTATGSKISYQWQFRKSSAGEWVNSGMTGATTNSITVQGTTARNGYQYRCIITDGSGNKVTSNGATLTVAPKLAITSQPTSQSVTEGASAVFKVTATGSKLSYQWQFRTSSAGEWKNSGMAGATTGSITVQGTAARNGYQYRCIITDGIGNKVTSTGATLTVAPKLAITGQPASQSVAKGTNAVFKVTATGSNLSYQWQVKTVGATKWTNSGMAGAKTSSISVQGTSARNGYQYRCIITDGNGNKVTSNGATLTVN